MKEVTVKNAAATESGTYTALDTSKKYNADLKGYVDYFKAVLQSQSNVIGVAACTGDKGDGLRYVRHARSVQTIHG